MPNENKADNVPANQQKGKKFCSCCHDEKKLTDFYLSYSPLYSLDKRVPICKECCKISALNEDGSIDEIKFNELLRSIDKPYYKNLILSSQKSFKKENSYVSDDEVKFHGKEILQKYFTLIAMRQDRAKSYSDSEKDGFIHQKSNTTKKEKEEISQSYKDVFDKSMNNQSESTSDRKEELIYSKEWKGSYTQRDIENLNEYYAGLNRDYKIITANHRDYARKIAKASLQMDKCYEDMIKGVDGADKKYKDAMTTFDTLSKSAKFSESTRSVNDVGISGFAKVSEIVEAHNWIPKHMPKEKDVIDEMLEYLSTITKSI